MESFGIDIPLTLPYPTRGWGSMNGSLIKNVGDDSKKQMHWIPAEKLRE